jgi:hypothetical protein
MDSIQVTMFWIVLAVVLFCMPVSLPVEAGTMSEFFFTPFPSPPVEALVIYN